MTPDGNTVFLQIQNSKKPEQLISLVLDESDGHFETEGLRGHFGLDEIRIDKDEFLRSMDDFAHVISFLLETMSAAQDLNLPYSYQELFEHKGQNYLLLKGRGYRLLSKQE